MRKLFQIFNLSIIVCLFMSSCSKSLYTSNGAKDQRPLLFESEYDIQELDEISSTGKAFWGIPISQKKYKRKKGMILYFNGVALTRTPKILPVLTLLGLDFAIGNVFYSPKETVYDGYYDDNWNWIETTSTTGLGIGTVPAYLIALPIAGTINNFIWSGAVAEASSTIERRLIEENPDIDLFFFPKYEVKKYNVFNDGYKYLWWQEADVDAKVKGATIKSTK